MPLQPGTTLGAYSVTAKIGEGGMGEVWQARDTTLDRDVALKVLPEAFTADPDRLARFEREAKVLASLNHPNIGSIYGLEEQDGIRALVLELVEGPTLADRIKQGPIPIDEALPIAKQIAEALEAAHEQGVIHRDLKPANIKVKTDGTVKVLDFGLAKAFQPDASDPNLSVSPTISMTAAATQMGMVIGTAAYMAPEQAKGLTVAKRADIWAYGAVLFEMLTSKKLFDAGDVSEMLASVLVRDPDISSIGNHVPAHIRAVVRQCLVKDPKERLRDIGDVRLAMKGVFETTARAPQAPDNGRVVQSGWRQAVPFAAGTLVVGALLSGLGVWSVTRSPAPRLERYSISPPAPEEVGVSGRRRDVAISPDGARVVYSATGGAPFQLVVRALDSLIATPLTGLNVGVFGPFVSPDSAWLGFYDNEDLALKKVSILGASWGEDDTIVFGTDAPGGLWRVSASGGEPEEFTAPDREQGQTNHAWPHVLPGGRAVLFTILTDVAENAQIAVLNLDTGEQRVLLSGGSAPQYSATGHIVYGVGGTLRAVRFDLDRLEVTEPNPVPVLDGVVTKGSGAANFALARDGSLAYVSGQSTDSGVDRQLVWVDRAGNEEPLDLPTRPYLWPRLSPDGARVLVSVEDSENPDIWIGDVTRGTLAKLTTEPGLEPYRERRRANDVS